MKVVSRIILALLVILSISTYASERNYVPDGVRVAHLSDAGKPGSGVGKLDMAAAHNALAGDIRGRITTNDEPRVAAFDGAIVKIKDEKALVFFGKLHRFSTVVIAFVYPDGEQFIFGALGIEEEATWFIPILEDELPPVFTLRGGYPTLKVQVFDPEVGLFTLTSGTGIYDAEPEGINEIRAIGEPMVEVVGDFARQSKVFVNFFPIPENSLHYKEGVIFIEKFDSETGGPFFYEGGNVVTVVTGDGECYSRVYDYNPPYEER